jgi:hypothetical protein
MSRREVEVARKRRRMLVGLHRREWSFLRRKALLVVVKSVLLEGWGGHYCDLSRKIEGRKELRGDSELGERREAAKRVRVWLNERA